VEAVTKSTSRHSVNDNIRKSEDGAGDFSRMSLPVMIKQLRFDVLTLDFN
jgi:hypothetical protein